MNAKYAKKANLNPNEAKATWTKLPASGYLARPQDVLNFDFCTLIFDMKNNNEPNFFTTKYALSISKTQKWRSKNNPKKRNKPNLNRSLIICG